MSLEGDSVFVIAEAGVNHNGDLDLARRLVDVAADAGADAVKFQTFRAERLASRNAPMADYQKAGAQPPSSQLDMLRRLELPYAWHYELQERACARGIEFLSTAFDEESLGFLVSLGIPRFKIPSGELTNAPLLWRFGRTEQPLILSTGMATLGEVETALAVLAHASLHADEPASLDDAQACWASAGGRQAVTSRVTLLHCTSQYPAPAADLNLRAMVTMAEAFGVAVGYSDHTEGLHASTAAVALGARVIEKHFTLDRSLPGPDHRASLEPDDLGKMIEGIRETEQMLGDGCKAPRGGEWAMRGVARQQVVAARDIAAGQSMTREDLATARCGRGIPAHELWNLLGRLAIRDFPRGEAIEE